MCPMGVKDLFVALRGVPKTFVTLSAKGSRSWFS